MKKLVAADDSGEKGTLGVVKSSFVLGLEFGRGSLGGLENFIFHKLEYRISIYQISTLLTRIIVQINGV